MAKAMNDSQVPLAKRQIEFTGMDSGLGMWNTGGHLKAVHAVGFHTESATCCGPCQIIAQTLSLMYWPKESTTPMCSDGPVTSLATLPPRSLLVARGRPRVNGSSIYAIVDGNTLYVLMNCASRFVLKLLQPEPRLPYTWHSKARCGFQTFVECLGPSSRVSRSQWSLAWSRL